jgi:hypothetical protein
MNHKNIVGSLMLLAILFTSASLGLSWFLTGKSLLKIVTVSLISMGVGALLIGYVALALRLAFKK